jgi:hypothetical protein
VFLAWISQTLKIFYDNQAEEEIRNFVAAKSFYNVSGLFIFNQVCMFLDSVIIIIAAISLLKYTSLLMPDLNQIILTI